MPRPPIRKVASSNGSTSKPESSKASRKTQPTVTIPEPTEDEAAPSKQQRDRPRGSLAGSKRKAPPADASEEETEDIVPVPTLEVRRRRVKESVMMAKWTSLGENSQAEAFKFLKSLRDPVLQSLRTEKERAAYQQALDATLRKFQRGLSKVLVAPGHKDKFLDYEYLNAENTRLQAKCLYEQRQIAELTTQISREKRAIDRAKKQEETLGTNAKHQKEIERKKLATLHPALRYDVSDNIQAPAINLEDQPSLSAIVSYDVSADRELVTTSRRMENHLVSMQGNREALGDLPEYLQATKAVVDDVLYQCGKYDAVTSLR